MMRVADDPRRSPEPSRMKPVPLYDPYENRHKFQKEVKILCMSSGSVKLLTWVHFGTSLSTSTSDSFEIATSTWAAKPITLTVTPRLFCHQLIDQQRALLQEQKRMIEDIQEQRRLAALQSEIAGLREQKKALVDNGTPAIPSIAVSETSSSRK